MKASSCHKGKKSAKHFIRKYGQTAKTAPGAVSIFAEDMAEKLGITPRIMREKIQTVRKFTSEVGQIVKNNHWGMKAVLELSYLEPAPQEETVSRSAVGKSSPRLGSKHFASLENS